MNLNLYLEALCSLQIMSSKNWSNKFYSKLNEGFNYVNRKYLNQTRVVLYQSTYAYSSLSESKRIFLYLEVSILIKSGRVSHEKNESSVQGNEIQLF